MQAYGIDTHGYSTGAVLTCPSDSIPVGYVDTPPPATTPPARALYAAGAWTIDPNPQLNPGIQSNATGLTKLTKRAFQARFPLTADGVSTKYDLLSLFLQDDGYAASLGVSGATLYQLRAMTITGLNRLSASADVDYEMPYAANFLQLMQQSGFPAVFRLLPAEAAAILNNPIQPSETPS